MSGESEVEWSQRDTSRTRNRVFNGFHGFSAKMSLPSHNLPTKATPSENSGASITVLLSFSNGNRFE